MEFPEFQFLLRTGTSIGLQMDQKRRAKQHDKYGFLLVKWLQNLSFLQFWGVVFFELHLL